MSLLLDLLLFSVGWNVHVKARAGAAILDHEVTGETEATQSGTTRCKESGCLRAWWGQTTAFLWSVT